MDRAPTRARPASSNRNALITALLRRVVLLEREVKLLRSHFAEQPRRAASAVAATKPNLAWSIEMDQLEFEDVKRLDRSRRETPRTFKTQERARLEFNRKRRQLNSELRAHGLPAQSLWLPLDARIKKLHQAGNWPVEETAHSEGRSGGNPRKPTWHRVRSAREA